MAKCAEFFLFFVQRVYNANSINILMFYAVELLPSVQVYPTISLILLLS